MRKEGVKKTGTFYGVGVGPGDPELLTLKARRVLTEAGAVAVPTSNTSTDGLSQALSIARKAVDLAGKKILDLVFPMTKDKEVLRKAREAAARAVVAELESGSDVAFITLGDPMLYSTFSYLVPFVRALMPVASIKSVPGISSYSAAASAALTPLAESDERVIIIPAAYDTASVRAALEAFDTIVLMKVNRSFEGLYEMIKERGLEGGAIFVSRVGWPEEEVITGIDALKGRKLDYFSMMIIKK